MSTAAADSWIDTEDADDFWDDDLGSINDDQDWDVEDTPIENTHSVTAPAVQADPRQEEALEGAAKAAVIDVDSYPELSAESGVVAKPQNPEVEEISTATSEEGHVSGDVEEQEEHNKINADEVDGSGIEAGSPEAAAVDEISGLPHETPESIESPQPGSFVNPRNEEVVAGVETGTSDAESVAGVDSREEAALDTEPELSQTGSAVPEIEGLVLSSPESSEKTVEASERTMDGDASAILPPDSSVVEDVPEAPLFEEPTLEAELDENLLPAPVSDEGVIHEVAVEKGEDLSDPAVVIEENSPEIPAEVVHEAASSGVDELSGEAQREVSEAKFALNSALQASANNEPEEIVNHVPETIETNDGAYSVVTTQSFDQELEKDNHSENPTKSSACPNTESSDVDELKAQIKQLKEELEAKNTSGDSGTLELKLHEAEKERDDAKSQLEGFLSKISSMKTVFRNYKVTQEELEQTQQKLSSFKEKVETLEQEKNELEEQNLQLLVQKEKSESRVAELEAENEKQQKSLQEVSTRSEDLNSENGRLSSQLSSLRRELNSKDETSQDEKYVLENEISKLAKKISQAQASYSELEIAEQDLRMENKNLLLVIEELKESLANKEREEEKSNGLIEKNKQASDKEKETLQARIQEIETNLHEAQKDLSESQEKNHQLLEQAKENEEKSAKLAEENEKIAQLQEDIHSKQVIIGKLRHEAVILNEHLTKSLSMLKQNSGDAESTVDKELVSNLIVKFVQIPRGDTKKFETLSLIGGLLNWDEKRKIEAGLINSGSKSEDGKPVARSSFISLWTDFLDKESKNKG